MIEISDTSQPLLNENESHKNNMESFVYDGERIIDQIQNAVNIIVTSNVTEIPDGAFYDCTALTSISLPPSVTLIGREVFRNCSSLSSIVIPPSVTTVQAGSFSGCSSLTSIHLPTSVTTIERCAFRRCSSLTSLTLPSSCKCIAVNAFGGCTSLEAITLPSSVDFLAITADRHMSSSDRRINNRYKQKLCRIIQNNALQKNKNLSEYSLFSSYRIEPTRVLNVIGRNDLLRNIDNTKFCVSTLFVNWDVCARNRKLDNGRLTLYNAIEEDLLHVVSSSEEDDDEGGGGGLNRILFANGAAIEEPDPITGLEAFMFAAIGPNSRLSSIYILLQYYPAAIVPHVDSVDMNRKRVQMMDFHRERSLERKQESLCWIQ